MFKKAQTATEYLIILAVVIVIALIVVGVLGGIPSIGGGAGNNALASQAKSAEIGVDSVALTQWGTSLRIRNNQPTRVSVSAITVQGTDCDSNSGYGVYPALPKVLKPGQIIELTCVMGRLQSSSGAAYSFYGDAAPSYISEVWNLQSGNRAELDVTFTYTNQDSGAEFTTTVLTLPTVALTGDTNYGYSRS